MSAIQDMPIMALAPATKKTRNRKPRSRVTKDGSLVCRRCRRPKPACDFRWIASESRRHSHCGTCERIANGERRRTPEYRAMRASYMASPEGVAMQRRYEATPARRRGKAEAIALWRSTPRGKAKQQIANLAGMIRREADPAKVARLSARLAAWRRELARLDCGIASIVAAERIFDHDEEAA